MGNLPENSLAAGGEAVIKHAAPSAGKPGTSFATPEAWVGASSIYDQGDDNEPLSQNSRI
jgi:hypothetical protein